MIVFCGASLAADGAKIPACMIVDDAAPFFNCHWVNHQNVCKEIPTSFYVEFGRWAEKNRIKGKFSVVPCLGGIKPIDGSLGEYPDHTRQQRLEWIDMIKTLYAPRFTITPEVITHYLPWGIDATKLNGGSPKENRWLEAQSLEVQTRYIAEAMQMLKNVGLEAGGLTMCWSYRKDKNHVLGEATLHAAEKVFGLDYVMIFNDTGERPGLIYQREDGARAVSLRPNVGDCYDHTLGKKTEEDIRRDADKYIAADGQSGQFVDAIKNRDCLIFYTHIQTLYGNGSKSGLKVFQIAIERLHKHFGKQIEWMTGLEIARRFCPPAR
jgi:hypothetical protein